MLAGWLGREHGIRLSYVPWFLQGLCLPIEGTGQLTAQVKEDWICYRRNYINMAVQLRSEPPESLHLCTQEFEAREAVHRYAFAVCHRTLVVLRAEKSLDLRSDCN